MKEWINHENKISIIFLVFVSIGIFVSARGKYYYTRYPEMVVMQEIGEYNEVHFDSPDTFSGINFNFFF